MNYVFTSARLGFRIFHRSDAKALYRHHSERDYKRWFPNESYGDIREAREAIRRFRHWARKKKFPYVLAIVLLETDELIGDVGLNEVWDGSGKVEIGYSICEAYQGHGYAAEAVAAMSAFAAAKFPIDTLYGRVLYGNGASCKVMQKSGFQFIGTEDGAKDDPYGKGMLLYARTLANKKG